MADETTNDETQDEAPVEPEPETTEAPEGAAEVEDVPAEAEPEEPSAEAEAPEEAAAAAEPQLRGEAARKKRKRLPRSLRPQRSKRRRERPAERKPIVRLPKPEHERGRRQERQGTVVSASADKTIVVRVDVVKVHPMYKKVVRRSTKLHAHDEQNEAKVGDVVRLVETRPLSKLKRWRLQEVVEAAK
jgi:small subunit ribosomal protein S17